MFVDTGYRPRPHQAEVHRALKRFNVLVCHRRFGKTVLCVNELIDRALRLAAAGASKPRLAYIAPFYRQAKAVAWDYLKTYTAAIPKRRVYEGELRVDLPGGARIALFGADNPDSLRGVYLDWVVLDEYAQMRPSLWGEVIRPALADRGGGAIFIGTPKGRNQFWEIYTHAQGEAGWHAALYRASETGIIPQEELAAARRQMSREQYEQEFECSFQAAVIGAYYGRELVAAEGDGRIGRVPWEPAATVETWWDLGIDDATAIWFAQSVGREVRLIDYYEASGAGLDHYAKVLGERVYVYGRHILPHDAQVRELGTGRSRVETLAILGLRVTIARQQSLEDGINAVRVLLPRCWFDAGRCARGLEALRQYRAEYDERLGAFSQRPLHNWASHAADAFRYGAVTRREAGPAAPEGRAITGYSPLEFGMREDDA
ncbi:MAG: hypothetical protein H6842_15300 [Rhodospirillaceae bacterium]|nr:hypothetical protein [Rhodospirillaceae bacterium]